MSCARNCFIGIVLGPRLHDSSQSQWPRRLRRRSAAERFLGSWVRIPQRAWMFVFYECLCCQRSLWRADPSSRGVVPTVVCVWVWSSENRKQPRHLLWTGRRGKDCETNERFTEGWMLYLSLSCRKRHTVDHDASFSVITHSLQFSYWECQYTIRSIRVNITESFNNSIYWLKGRRTP
jgi:hypothetical protein